MQSHSFVLPFFLLPIQGDDLVLGIEQLQTLEPILSDFSVPYMKFTHLGKQVTLQGESSPLAQIAFFQQVCHLIHMDSVASFHLLSMENIPPPHTPFTHLAKHPHSSDLQALLLVFLLCLKILAPFLLLSLMTTISLFCQTLVP